MYHNRISISHVSKTSMRIAADSKYWLYLNGKLIVREGGLKRGPVPDGGYYDEVEISEHLQDGENVFAVLLCYFGRHSFSHRDSGTPGLLVEADGIEFGNWKAKRHPAYFDPGYVQDAYRLSENSVGFDARNDLAGWTENEFDDANWPEAVAAGKAGDAPWGPLEKREFKQWFWSDLKEYEAVEAQQVPDKSGAIEYHCKLRHNAHFVPVMDLQATAGIRIEVTVPQDTHCLSPIYIAREGQQRFESEGWMNGEKVIYRLSATAVKIEKLYYRETGFPSTFTGSFSNENPLLNKLWKKARRTLYVTMRDNFMDCPCRERAQWPGDMVVQLGQVSYCLDREADLLVKKGLRELLRWQREDGIIYGPVPEGNWRMELPAQMLSVISPYGIWTYYMNTADVETLAELYPFAKRYLDIWEIQDNGLIKYRPAKKGSEPKQVDGVSVGIWDWIDWGERIDAEPALNAWFVLAATGIRQMADTLGHAEDAYEIQKKENQVRAAFQSQYWNEERGGFISSDFEFDPDDRVQALAVLCGASTPPQFPHLKRIFETVEQACPYMEKYILEALFKMGETELALDRMSRRYRTMVENENSTLWELWPEKSVEHPGTINHSWSGGPLTLLSGVVAGIHPLEPGWTKFTLSPKPGKLKKVSCSVLIPQGEICLNAIKEDLDWQVELTVPEGTTAVPDFSALTKDSYQPEIKPGKQNLTLKAKPDL